MYDHSSLLIVAVLFVLLIAATELGFRLGFRFAGMAPEASKGQITTIQGSLLGVLALLLGFTFSLSLQRFDSRSEAVISEANAIGTTMLRARLLPESVRDESRRLLREYLDSRVRAGAIPISRAAEREAVLAESQGLIAARAPAHDDRLSS